MTQVKFFKETTRVDWLEESVNEFLKTLDSSCIKKIAFNSHQAHFDTYTAMVVYETND